MIPQRKQEARIEKFWLKVCGQSGDPGCLGWPDGGHFGRCIYAKAPFNRCSECGADDVYGDICHEETCSLAALPDTPPGAPTQAIPPAYTEQIGLQIIAHLRAECAP